MVIHGSGSPTGSPRAGRCPEPAEGRVEERDDDHRGDAEQDRPAGDAGDGRGQPDAVRVATSVVDRFVAIYPAPAVSAPSSVAAQDEALVGKRDDEGRTRNRMTATALP